MDERNYRANRQDEENETKQAENRNSSGTDDSSYYYSYGPFQSVNQEDTASYNGEHNQREEGNVEITRPDPVKPVPTYYSNYSNESSDQANTSSRGGGGNGSGGNGGDQGNGGKNNGNWNYNNRRPRSSVRSLLFSFIAGMLVITVLMYTADRTNMFTPQEALTSAENESSSQSSTPTNSGSSNNVTASLLPTGKEDVSSVVTSTSPAVVKIETLAKQSTRSSSQGGSAMSDPLYQYFFGGSNGGTDSYQGQNQQQQQQSSNQLVPLGIGSGFIFDKEGYILTNQHVVQGADVIQVTLENNSKPYEAKLLGSSFDLDLAVLKIEKNSGDDAFPVAPLGDSNSTQVGEWLVAIGNPEGFEHTVTAGVLSAKERTISIPDEETGKTREYSHLLQTDASINPGNSGGPLLNLNGEVIGMNVAVSADAQGIGFAIPSSVISDAVKYLKENKEVPKEPVPFIGASLMALTPEVAKQMGTDITEGSVVASTIYQSPAYQADLRAYDIITGANGTAYSTSQDLIDFIKKQKIGSEVTLNVVRDGKKMDVKIKIGNKNDYDTTQTTDQQQQQQP
ncbi:MULTISPECIES: S1C family serine protease [Paenibacillus]|uniref:S1-C subfamily serine protease n=1 Tax=Paenibacillus pabuli TaxID=1472 RepID=A0A855Y7L0_9BACL|nr:MULTISPECIES: trypsin-like peptidase domain-containing protein [Paenibacillus]PWW40980.1 S1-C subfamily serine protease [Paenibacillus pabuli]PXW12104.1 S1-C subfamily serine protease [Paenibacillus taichungensis]RAI97181.1 S1-C subfamily serine protease [Paenibacillus pabuli]